MTDKELLELAANANEVPWKRVTAPRYGYETPGLLMRDEAHEVDYYPAWNPLENDGDALRLAVKLRFGIKDFAPHDNPELEELPSAGMVEIWSDQEDDDPIYVEWYKPGDDRYAATRRAITRAAAVMGGAK